MDGMGGPVAGSGACVATTHQPVSGDYPTFPSARTLTKLSQWGLLAAHDRLERLLGLLAKPERPGADAHRIFYGGQPPGFLSLGLAWEMFSIFYYGFPFPNTAYAKLNTASVPAS